jgi:hypothetical protein
MTPFADNYRSSERFVDEPPPFVPEDDQHEQMTDLAERAALGVRELQPTCQLCLEDTVLGGQILAPRQQLLVPRPGHVSQDARPIHYRHLPHTFPRRRHLGPSATSY